MIQIKKTILTLVALLAVTTGAWADETPLLTIESKYYSDFTSGSETFDNKVTVTFSNEVENDGDDDGWYNSGWSNMILSVTPAAGYTITKVKFYCGSGSAFDETSPFEATLYAMNMYVNGSSIGSGGVNKIEVYGYATPAASTGPEVAWDKATKTGKFTMPGGNVTLEPEYYPQATVADGAVTAADADARATTDDPLVKVDATKLTGAKKLMYFVSNSGTTAPAYDAEGWTDQLPTAEGFTQQGIVYVWYYPVGIDEGVDGATATYSDGDICLQSITARIAAEPTYAVTFAEGTDPNEWTASPDADVKKGQTVTVTYTGSKKVIGVKAEKKAAAKPLANATTEDLGKVVGADGNIYANKAAAEAANTTAVAMICYVNEGHGLALALSDEGDMDWNTALTTCAAHTPAVTGATWKLASKSEMNLMINAAGNYAALRNGFSAVGGTNMSDDHYWLSDESTADYAQYIEYYDGSTSQEFKSDSYKVRACLAF